MPLFEYRCSCCGQVEERLVRVPVPDSLVCPACGGEAWRQVALPARPAGAECDSAPGAT